MALEMSDEDMIRMEDLTHEMIGLDPDGRNLTDKEHGLLDKYVEKQDFDYIVQTLDAITNRVGEEGNTDQRPLYALMQWLVNAMWRYIDLHDHRRRGEHVSPTMEAVKLEPQILNISECGTPECGPNEEE
jgi:hypothetical protein